MKMKRTLTAALVAATFVLGLANHASATLIASFEGALDANWNASGPAATFGNTIGVTEGSDSLKVAAAAGWQQSVYWGSASVVADLIAGATLDMDVTIPADAGVAPGDDWADVYLVIQGDGQGWLSTAAPIATNGTTETQSWDYHAAGATLNPAAAWFEIILIVNSGAARDVYVDNIRIASVPEPSSLLLVGMGGLASLGGLVRRRR